MSTQVLEKKQVKSKKNPNLLIETIPVPGYERVLKFVNKEAKLNAIISLHNTTLGCALGGIRIYPYASEEKAMNDVLRLSKGMTYKSAIAEVGFGGGKSVIIADPKKDKTPELLRAFGEAVEELEGMYICAEDSGCSMSDVMIVREATKYVVGLSHEKSSGDPGGFTAWGVFRGIQSVLKKIFHSDSLEGRRVAVQGLGNVGFYLVEYLFWAGAEIVVTDINSQRLKAAVSRFGVKTVAPEEIFGVECDVFAPCAFGGIVNDETIRKFKCKAIAGGANNQLLREDHGDELKDKGILYAPDFVINGGGLLNVAAELYKDGYHPQLPRAQTHKIYDRLMAIYEIAEKNKISTNAAAIALAEYRIKYGIGKRIIAPHFHHTL